ncbi:hypothetical protein TWF730_002957 [Orbilia blumenaviensis]|uniref:Uncharacterized protein n=1 Tax=Orbilia blumenaviensis TaxID=1796055 RepID=A0AAV9U7M8_9PEZI
MSLFWKRKSVAPSTDSTVPILDAPIHSDEASSLNGHPVLVASNSTESYHSSQLHQNYHQPPPSAKHSESLIDFADETSTQTQVPGTNFRPSYPSNHTMTTASAPAPLGESIHQLPPDTISGESEKAQLTPTQQKRRSFFSFGKKKQPNSEDSSKNSSAVAIPPITTISPPETKSTDTNSTTSPVSPVRSSHFGSQRRSKAGSPRLSTSSIFERNVQDPSLPPGSPSIPTHFSTENHIPAVLEATSLAITDSSVDPDRVEIVSSTSHHPVLPHPETYSNPWAEESAHSGDESIGHGYTSSLASADKRRLSFISFADVVQAENEQASHSSTNLESSQISKSTVSHANREPSLRSNSPIRTPPQVPHSPPGTGLGLSDFSMEKDMSIPAPSAAGHHSEVTVETLSQALRKHGSTDLKAAGKPHGQQPSLGASAEFENPWRD